MQARIGLINDFLEAKLVYFEKHVETTRGEKKDSKDILDNLFRDVVINTI